MSYQEDMALLLDQEKYTECARYLERISTVDASDILSDLDTPQLAKLFRLLKKDMAAPIFAELSPDVQRRLLEAFTDTEISAIIANMFLDDTVDMLEELPAGMVSRLISLAPKENRSAINRLLQYDENSAGSVMTTEFVTVYESMTAVEALERVRVRGRNMETVYVIYVTDAKKILRGSLELKQLLFSEDHTLIKDIMEKSVVSIETHADKQEAAALIAKYDLLALPVVDSEQRLVGIVTVDDALDVITEEAAEDMEIMAAIMPTDTPYLKTKTLTIWRNRIPWLLLLLLSATVTGAVISHYESALQVVPILISFIPMIMSTGGNAGSQASVTVIRGLSLGELQLRDVGRILWKELRVSLLCGIVLSFFVFLKATYIDKASVTVALVVSLTLLLTVIFAKLIGGALPVIAKALRLDPAIMASPFITTTVDTVSLLLYFAIASAALGI